MLGCSVGAAREAGERTQGTGLEVRGSLCSRTCCCFERAWVGVFLALEVPGGAVVSVVCGDCGSLSYELQLWGGRVGFGHVRGSSGCLCVFLFCPHLRYVCDDGGGGWGGVFLWCGEAGLLCVRACIVGRGGWPVCVFEGTWLHVLTFCRVGGMEIACMCVMISSLHSRTAHVLWDQCNLHARGVGGGGACHVSLCVATSSRTDSRLSTPALSNAPALPSGMHIASLSLAAYMLS
jgi:hypothetical protein